MYNKKVLSTAKKELNKAKAPKKPKDIITDPMGQWKYPGLPTRIPGNDITMKGVGYPVLGVGNNGQRKIMLPGGNYTFPGADYVDEYPQMKRGGERKRRKTKSLSGTNELMLQHPLLRNYKNRVYDPNVDYFQDGGMSLGLNSFVDRDEEGNTIPVVIPSVSYSKGNFNADVSTNVPAEHPRNYEKNINLGLGYNKALGKRGQYGNLGLQGDASISNNPYYNVGLEYTTPYDKKLGLNFKASTSSLKDLKNNLNTSVGLTYRFQDGGYIEAELTPEEIEEYRKGGYIVEDISVPELNQAQKGKTVKSKDGTITNRITKANGDTVIQVKTKDGKYYEKVKKGLPQFIKDEFKKRAEWEDRSSGAAQPVDWVWTLPLAATRAPFMAGEALSGLMATEIPGLAGTNIGQAINAGFIGKGLYDAPSTVRAWQDVAAGKKDWKDAAEKTAWNLLDFTGAGETKEGLKLLAEDSKALNNYLTTQTPLRNAYTINPFAVKENPEMFLYRARPVGQNLDMNMAAQIRAKEAAGEPLTWWQKNLLNPQTNPQMLAREKYYGQWFEKDPSRLDFYINPETRNFADNDAIEILRTRLPKEEAAKLNVSQFDDAKILSASPETEFILPKDMINSAEKFPENSWQQLVQEDKAFNTPHWLRGYQEGGESAPVKELDEVTITPVSMYQQEYKDANSYDDFYNQKVDEYLRNMPKGLGKMMGIDSDRIPSNLIKKINAEYQYNMNNYVTDQVLKNKKYDVNAREKWVDKLTPSEYEAFADSKYTGKLKPNLWTRTRAGVRALGNTLLPGQPISYDIKGLTPKEQKQYKEDKFAAFDALAAADLPGAWVGNYLVDSRDYVDRPDLLSGELNANLAEGAESLLNPLAYAEGAGLYDVAKAGFKTVKNARQARKLNKILENLQPIDYDNLIPSGWDTVDGNTSLVTEATTQVPQLRPITDFTSNSLMRSDALQDVMVQWANANNINENIHLENIRDRFNDLLDGYNLDLNNFPRQLESLSEGEFNNFRNDLFNVVQDVSPDAYNNASNVISDATDSARNRSYLSRKKILEKAKDADKLKKQLDELTPEQFEQTVYKPTGELTEYVPVDKLDRLQYVPHGDWSGKMIHKDAIPISTDSYTTIFNENIDKLNEIIRDYNKSGLSYEVTELTPGGTIKFRNPKQVYKRTPTTKQLEQINKLQDEINTINKSLEKGLYNSEADITEMLSRKDYAEKRLKRFDKALKDEEIPEGTSSFGVNIIPGQWRGEVEDIANSDYYKYLPGLNMSYTTGSVFSDKLPRRGTGFYEALNEYLKKYDLGRVKPGFNSQTEYSEGLWNNAILKGKAHGFYGGSDVLHGSFKKKGGIVVELSDDEIQDYINQGYIVEEIDEPKMQTGGQLPYQVWQEKTGTPWSEAKRQGLTDGSASANIALMNKLLAGETPAVGSGPASKVTPVQSGFNYDAYDRNVKQMVSNGASLEDLVNIRMGTREGLVNRFPDLFSASNAKSKEVNKINIPQNKQTVATKVDTIVNKPDTAQITSVLPKLRHLPESTITRIPAPKVDTPIVKKFEKSKIKAKEKIKQKETEDLINNIRQQITPDTLLKQKRTSSGIIPLTPKPKTPNNFRPVIMDTNMLPKVDTPQQKIEAVKNFRDIKGDPKKYIRPELNLPKEVETDPMKKQIKVKAPQDIMQLQNTLKPSVKFKKGSKLTIEPEKENKIVKEDADYKVISNLTQRLNKFDESLQSYYYDYTNPHHTPEKRKQATQNFKAKIAERNNLINLINSKKRDYAGGLDSWIDESAPAWIKKPAQKMDLSDQVEATSYKLPTLKTFKQKEEEENEKFKTTKRVDDLGGNEKGSRWQFRVSASNDDPMKVQLYGTRGERNPNLNIKAKGAVMHFLDQSPLTGYVHPTTKAYYRDLKQDAYVGKLEKLADGNYGVKYVPKKDIPAKDLTKNTFLVRQEKFDNIDFNKKVRDDNFSGHTYWTKKGTNKATVPISSAKDANVYDYSSGQSVVFIFPYKGKTRYVHFAGSPNAIKKEGEEIKKQYKLQANKLVLGVADAGSYSSAVKGNITDKKLKDWNYGYANRNSFTGAGMALVD